MIPTAEPTPPPCLDSTPTDARTLEAGRLLDLYRELKQMRDNCSMVIERAILERRTLNQRMDLLRVSMGTFVKESP